MAEEQKQDVMTLNEIEALEYEFLPVDIVADYMGVAAQSLRCAYDEGQLDWAVKIGNRLKIPKRAFVSYCRNGRAYFRGTAF